LSIFGNEDTTVRKYNKTVENGIALIRYAQNRKIGKPGITFIRYAQNRKTGKPNNLIMI
jgi:hypothetical protein